jgi:hypothetical protein
MMWVTAGICAIMFLVFPILSMMGALGFIAFALGMWVVLELGRAGWCRWSLQSQFDGPPSKAYKDADKAACSQHPHFLLLSWFDTEAVLANEGSFWIRIPMSRIERIRIDDSGIEFLVGSLKLYFHREGFRGPEAWEQACQAARTIRLVPSSSSLSMPG